MERGDWFLEAIGWCRGCHKASEESGEAGEKFKGEADAGVSNETMPKFGAPQERKLGDWICLYGCFITKINNLVT